MRPRPIRRRSNRPTASLLRRLSALLCLLALIGVGLADNFAWAQRTIDSPMRTAVSEVTGPDSTGHTLPTECAVHVVCPISIPVADAQDDILDQKSARIPIGSENCSGRITTPASPPPKPLSQA